MLTGVYFVIGLALLGAAGCLVYFGLPRGGVVRTVGDSTLVGELYTFAILISLATGMAFLINAVTTAAG